jgi:protein-tyrosine phosphatase
MIPIPPIPEAYWVEPAHLLAGQYPGGFDEEKTRRRMDAFLSAGINTFIDLTQPHELVPYEAILREQAKVHGLPVSYMRFPILDFGTPAIETMKNILDTLDGALAEGLNVYVHCWAGVGRTGTTVGCYLVRRGFTGQQALAHITEMRSKLGYRRSPETEEQVQFVLNWNISHSRPNGER